MDEKRGLIRLKKSNENPLLYDIDGNIIEGDSRGSYF